MIGFLLITHGTPGDALLQCASRVLNQRPERLLPLGVGARDEPPDLRPLALKLLQPGHIEGVPGVDLPMLIRALTYRNQDIHTLCNAPFRAAATAYST